MMMLGGTAGLDLWCPEGFVSFSSICRDAPHDEQGSVWVGCAASSVQASGVLRNGYHMVHVLFNTQKNEKRSKL